MFPRGDAWEMLTVAVLTWFRFVVVVVSLCLFSPGIEFRSTLNNMKDELPMLKEVRGRGLLNAIVIEENFGPNQDKDAMDVSGKRSGQLLLLFGVGC